MPTVLTDADTFAATVSVPASADARTAASVQSPFQTLADRTRWLHNRLTGLSGLYEDSATRIVNISHAVFVPAEWSVYNTEMSIQADDDSVDLLIPVDSADAPHGCTITAIAARLATSHADTGSERMSVAFARCTIDGTETILSSVGYTSGSGAQTVTVSGLSLVLDRSLYRYYLRVTSGNNATSYSKAIHGASITRTLP